MVGGLKVPRPATLTVAVSVCVASVVLAISAPGAGAKAAWSITPFPKPAASTVVDFEGVSCPSAKSCFAVGSYKSPRNYKTLVEHWNGTKWSVMTSPNPVGSANSSLQAVSCVSATRCFAVGYSSQGPSVRSLVEAWNGGSWSVTASPSPAAWTNPALGSVSCSSPTSCFAVGGGRATTGESLVEHWDGNAWSVVTIETLTGSTETSLFGVSCPSATDCFAVGFYQPSIEAPLRTLVEHWDGSSWSVMTSPNPTSTKAIMSDVSCPRTNSCVAVGQYLRGTTGKTLVEGWSGTGWSLAANPDPAASTNSWLKSVSCPTPTSCFAVGTGTVKKVTSGLIERYG